MDLVIVKHVVTATIAIRSSSYFGDHTPSEGRKLRSLDWTGQCSVTRFSKILLFSIISFIFALISSFLLWCSVVFFFISSFFFSFSIPLFFLSVMSTLIFSFRYFSSSYFFSRLLNPLAFQKIMCSSFLSTNCV
jgi:hypothetical protein